MVRRRFAVSLIAAVVCGAVWSSTAWAHNSEYTEHSVVAGPHWRLVYLTYKNDWGFIGNCPGDYGYHHYHYVDHYYRGNTSGPFSYQHTNIHYVTYQCGRPVHRSANAKAPPAAADHGDACVLSRGDRQGARIADVKTATYALEVGGGCA